MLERRDTSEPIHVRICCYSDQSANSISSRGDYSIAVSISFRACSGAATIRECVYSRAASIQSYTVYMYFLLHSYIEQNHYTHSID